MKNESRIILIIAVLIIITLNLKAQSPSLGAIRWDAYTGALNSVGVQVEEALSPSRFHYRIPFFGVEIDSGHVSINGSAQSIMDREIDYAHYAGLNYWAFVWYASSSGLDESRKLYYSSKKKNLIDYCLIVEQNWFTNGISINDLVKEFQDSSYFRVLNGRPLLYFLGYASIKSEDIDTLRQRSIAAGAGNPYIVECRVDGNMNVVDDLHMDAFGMYATSWISNASAYSSLADADLGQWNYAGKTCGKKVVPHVTTGWDTRPIYSHPLSWYTISNPNDYVVSATPAQISDHITDAIKWSNANPGIAEANTILIYAWNEHVEGGWICPTLSNYGFTDRIDTMHTRFAKSVLSGVEKKQNSYLKVYPNPAHDILKLNVHDYEPWTVISLYGFTLLKGYGPVCNISSLANGIYILRTREISMKIIKV